MAVLAAMCAVARAQQLVCEPCVRGDDTLKQLGDAGTLLRSRGHELVSVGVTPGGVIQDTQMTRLHDLLGDDPALTDTLADLSDAQLSDMAAAVCNAPDGHCTVTLAATLRCLAGRCHVEHHVIERMQDPPNPTCDPYVKKVTSPATGFGLEWGEGRQQDASPVDHRAWSFGFEGRRRIGRRFGVVGRVDRSNGRDASTDTNGDGRDDVSTGAVTRVSVLAGPTMMFAIGHADATRFAQVDLLGGYLWTLSQPHEDGPAAGVDLSYSLEVARVGVRAITGFGDAKDAHAVLAHVGFVLGAGPNFDYSAGCGHEEKSPTKVALAIDIPLFGFGLSSALDYSVPGFGVEAGYHVANFVDVMARGDLLVFPNSDRERTAYQSVLGGARIDLTEHTASSLRSGFFTTLMAGYAFAAGTEPTTAGSGPVVDASVGWGGEGDDGMAYLRLHGRFGLSPDNYDARAIFLSGGLELRLDRRQWKDRN
jgi:hypothetical protein